MAGTTFEAAEDVGLLKVVVDFGCGGTERQFVNLGLALDQDRFDLHFGCMKRSGYFLAEVEARGIPVEEYGLSTFYSVQCLKQQWRLARYIARHGIQIVHAYNFYGNVFALPAARWAAAPVVIASIRDRGVYLTRRQIAAQRYVCRLADCVLVNADAIKDWLIEHGHDAGKIVVIRNGLDLSNFSGEASRGDVRREFGLPPSAPIVGVVGRISPTKGIEDLIDAVAVVSRRHPDLRVLIVGEAVVTRDGSRVEDRGYVETLKDRARALGIGDRIVFAGYRSDVPALLSQFSVAVQPSLNEGLSNVVLESMASGVPVVATRVGGTPEAMVHDVTGLLVPAADPQALAGAISRLLEDPALAARLGGAAKEHVKNTFSLARMVQATEELYRELLARKGVIPNGRRRARETQRSR